MYQCGHSVQMTLMRYTDLSARPRHNNNHVLTQTPIITKPIITICETDLIYEAFVVIFVQYGFVHYVLPVWISVSGRDVKHMYKNK